jgi:hypothetical protein
MQQAADHIILLKMKSKIFSIPCGCTRRKAQQYIEHWHHFLAAGLSECAVEDLAVLTGPESLKRRYSSLQRQWGDSYEKSWLPHKKKMNLDVKYRQPLKKSMSTRT